MATEEAALIIPLTGPWIPTSPKRGGILASRDEAQIRIREFAKKKSLALDDRTRVESDGSFRYG